MRKVIPVICGAAAGLGMAYLGFNDLRGDFHEELRADNANAVIAQRFSDNKDNVAAEIGSLLHINEKQIASNEESFAPGCLAVINRVVPKTGADIDEKSKCTYTKDRINEARDLLGELHDEHDRLDSYINPGDFYETGILEYTASNADGVIKDAADKSVMGDMWDNRTTGSIEIRVENGTIVETGTNRDEYDGMTAIGYFVLSVLTGAAAGASANGVGNLIDKKRSSPTFSAI